MSGDTKKIKSGFVWVFFGTAGQNILQFAALIVLARLLTPGEFGLVTAAMIIIGLINIFAELGIGAAIVQKPVLTKQDVGTGRFISAGVGIMAGIVVYSLAGLFQNIMRIEGLAEVVQILALILPLAGLTVIGQSLLQRNMEFKKYIICLFASYFVSQILVAIPLALLGYGYYSLIIATLAQNVVLLILVSYLTKGQGIWIFKFDSAKQLSNYGFGQSLGVFSNYLAGQGDNFITGRQLGTADLGVYGRAYQLLMVPANLIGTVLDRIMFPVMSRIQENNKKLAEIYILNTSLVAMICVPITAFIFVCSDEIIEFLLGSQWISAAPVLQILICTLFFRTGSKISDSLSRAKGSVYKRAWRQAIYALAVAVFAFIGSPYGLEGIAFGVSLAIILNYFIMLQLSRMLIVFNFKSIVKIIIYNLAVMLFLIFILIRVKLVMPEILLFKIIAMFFCTLLIAGITYYTFKSKFKSEIDFIRCALQSR